MTPIHNIGNDLPSADRIKQQDKVSSDRSGRVRKDAKAPKASGVTSTRDTVDISPEALVLANSTNEVEKFQQMLKSLSSDDMQRMVEIKRNIELGEYDKPEVLEKISDSIARLPQFRSAGVPEEPSRPRASVEEITARVQSGKYSTDEVLDKVAASILNDITTF